MRQGRKLTRLWDGLVATLVAVFVIGLVPVPTLAAMPGSTCETTAYTYDAPALFLWLDTVASHARGSPERPGAASWASPAFVRDRGVAANTGGRAASELVLYSPQGASRNLLSQAGEGYATTPGGRAVSAHAADRIVNGGPGRSPTTLTRVDDILDNPTGLRYDPVRDTVRVSQGKDFVVVSGMGPGQHIVTVMVR